jgi:hypothetical protein
MTAAGRSGSSGSNTSCPFARRHDRLLGKDGVDAEHPVADLGDPQVDDHSSEGEGLGTAQPVRLPQHTAMLIAPLSGGRRCSRSTR